MKVKHDYHFSQKLLIIQNVGIYFKAYNSLRSKHFHFHVVYKKVKSDEMQFLLSIAGCTHIDQKRSVDIRSELKIYYLVVRIENQKEP
jgi:hypothetical protein